MTPTFRGNYSAGWIFPVLLAVSVAAHAGFFATRLAVTPRLAGDTQPAVDVIEVVLVEELPEPEPEPELPPEPEPEPEVEMEELPPEVIPEPEPVSTPQPTPQATPRPVSTPRPQAAKPRPPAPAPKTTANRVVKAKPDVSRNPPPRYPESARRAKQEGRVMVRASVSAEGRVQSVRIQRSSGHAVLDRAALDAVRKWRFVPQQVNGQSQASEVDVPVNFFLTPS
jgi:periplasmic protein TonB